MKKNNHLVKKLVLFGAVMSMLSLSVLAAPTVTVSLSNSSVDETSSAGTIVGSIVIDYMGEDTNAPNVYLSNGDDNFSIVSDESGYQLATSRSFDYETESYYDVTVIVEYEDTSANQTFTININNVDEEAPEADDVTALMNEDTTLNGSVTATNSPKNLSLLTYECVTGSGPSNGELTFNSDGSYTYTPDENFNGLDGFTFKASAGMFSDEGTVTITVSAVNDAPENTVAPSVVGTFNYGATLTASAGEWNDSADGGTSTLGYAYQWQTAEETDGPATDISGETSETYVITRDDKGKYIRIKVTCDDGVDAASAYSSWQYVSNAAPVAKASSVNTNEDTPLSGSVTATDADTEDTLTYTLVDDATNGELTFNTSNGSYTYLPDKDFYGSDTFTFKVYDGTAYSEVKTVTITVAAENDVPVNTTAPLIDGTLKASQTLIADKGVWSDAETSAASLVYTYQWQYAATEGGDPFNISGETGGTYIVGPTYKEKYIRVLVTCDDGEAVTTASSPWYHIENSAPVISGIEPQTMTMGEDSGDTLAFSATDADGDELVWSVSTNGTKGTATIIGSTVTYTPDPDKNGSDSFVVTVSDGVLTDSVTVNVT
ncbi:MAG: Ig-like domain-containing protein, partial [Clostridiaceae bacterium]|nr:Ig-like domain-containing protein [Clostridiaceae bacterium]